MRVSHQFSDDLRKQRGLVNSKTVTEIHKTLLGILPLAAGYVSKNGAIVLKNKKMSALINESSESSEEDCCAAGSLEMLLSAESWKRCEPLLAAAFRGVPAEASGPFRLRSGDLFCWHVACLPFLTLSEGQEAALVQFASLDDADCTLCNLADDGFTQDLSGRLSGARHDVDDAFGKMLSAAAAQSVLHYFPDEVVLFDAGESAAEKARLLAETVGGGYDLPLLTDMLARCGDSLPQTLYLPEARLLDTGEFSADRLMCEVRLVPVPREAGTGGMAIIRRNVDCPHEVAEYKRLAYQDPLTGLANRRAFTKSLKRELDRLSQDQETGLAVYYIDLDEFKKVNDLGGHDAGDDMLYRVATSLTLTLGEFGTAGRIGGDEFAGMVPAANEDAALEVAARILEGFSRIRLEVADRVFTISGSVGVAFVEAGLRARTADAAALLKLADSACLRGKRFGGHSVQIHALQNSEGEARGDVQVDWPDPRSFRGNELALYAMPIVDLQKGSVCGLEVLLRLQGERALGLSSRAWISAAERSGFIAQVDTWTLDKILDAAENNTSHGLLTMNISVGSAKDPNFKDRLFSRLCVNPDLASQLCLEISEQDLLREPAAVESFFDFVTGLGCRAVIDDFAGHWPVLSRLSRLPVDWIKLESGLTQQLDEEPGKMTVLGGLVRTAQDMGIKVIAKHVETQMDADMLQALDIEAALGFHFGKPEPWPAAG